MADLGQRLLPIIPSCNFFCSIILTGLIPVYLLQYPVDVIYPLLFASRLNYMHTFVRIIPHLNPAMLLPTSQSVLVLYFPSWCMPSTRLMLLWYLCGDSR